jgi:hypothetical protein
MFISKAEKNEIRREIVGLVARVRTLENSLSYVVSQLACLPAQEKKRKGRSFSEAEKLRSSERMKKYWADRKTGVKS